MIDSRTLELSCRLYEYGGQPKYTHVRHKFGAHPGRRDPIRIFVHFRNTFGIRKNSAKAWEREKFKMSAEEDTELRDMVAQTLESKGVLGKIRVRKCAIFNNVAGRFKIMAIKLHFNVDCSIPSL